MAKKKKAAREASAAVSCSRYTSPPVTLRVGSDLESYYVPEVLLQALNDLSRSEATEPTIDLPDVDVDTGHIIVHFLHTGQYQTLRNNEEETTPDYSKADFKKAIAAFIAAKKYGLTALQEVAKEQISECAESISVIQIAHGVGKDTLAALQEDAGWLQDLVLRKIEQTFKENDEIFSSASFFSGIKSLQLAKLCGQQVAKLYCFQSREVDKEVSELEKCEAKQGDLLRNWSGTEQADESAPTAQSDQAPVTGQASPPLPSVDEVPHDDWASFGFTKKKRKKARIALEEVPLKVPEPVAEPEPEPVLEPVMEAPSVEHIPVIAPHPVEEVVETTADNADVADPWASFDMSVSKKKKKKGKKIAVEEAPPPELYIPSQALEASESSPANVDSTSLNTWQDVPSVAPTEVIADVVLERATIVDDSPVIVEPPPTNEQEASWSWGATLASSKKKKRKKGKAAQDEASVSPPTPPAEPEEKMDDDLIEPQTASQPVPASLVDGDIRVVVTEETDNDEECPFLFEHLSQSQGWKDCRRCELYVRKIAIKLHTAGLPDINGLVAR